MDSLPADVQTQLRALAGSQVAAHRAQVARLRARRDDDAALVDALTKLAAYESVAGNHAAVTAAAEEAVNVCRALDRAARSAAGAKEAAAGAVTPHTAKLAECLEYLFAPYWEAGRAREAHAVINEAIGCYRAVLAAPTGGGRRRAEILPELANALSLKLRVQNKLEDWEATLVTYEEVAGLYRELVRTRPEKFVPNLAAVLMSLGQRFYTLGQLQKALAPCTEAYKLYKELATAETARGGHSLQKELSMAACNLGVVYKNSGKLNEALPLLLESVAIQRRELPHQPFTDGAGTLALNLSNLASLQVALNKLEEAVETATEAVALYRKLVRVDPAKFKPLLALNLVNYSARLRSVNRLDQCARAATETVALYRELLAAQPSSYAYSFELAGALGLLSDVDEQQGDLRAAVAVLEDAIVLYRESARMREALNMPRFVVALGRLSVLYERLDEPKRAHKASAELVQHFRKIHPGMDPAKDAAQLAHELANHLQRLGDLQRHPQVGAYAEAHASYTEAASLCAQFVRDDPANSRRYVTGQVDVLQRIIELCATKLGDHAGADRAFEEAVHLAGSHRRLDLLSSSLAVMSNHLHRRGPSNAALAAVNELVGHLRNAAAHEPDVFSVHLGSALIFAAACMRAPDVPPFIRLTASGLEDEGIRWIFAKPEDRPRASH